ncbi:UDP-N-acetylglucosamine--N-acetylmuramyl-(pentapeptide) pyrophosphoryl-undecaprenol N-acetylglucosamine transferase [Streptomyces sp. LX-29]|uniref:UDP-N-acetylglucosamine--N-acetylmuramyl- (pentapeptide) pyrophosphoryl-undecaprenol N-acetylglucosamine transferase n=1 Tax=Streptomyces sp. LX-29 TaxID=2900152 RepID=UPI00240D845B|nr:UDP-N-acetylglucosamine--N-acetylmuramyl-(pentapeptide) pyrophosphoryl-undecaprenol N-acetylglucosamine transferase [Streptomyces sp. LX-29]WFB11364.1 UDP-N-acetylglucosamine--N-acetylmuramyl-(pentapeptide) pyrophosphoryl-undecaprenol N-acetylglucosamine transferase [Streptomyces sp. LX-29]
MKIAITGGASAGHVVPALAVGDQLAALGAQLGVFLGRDGSIEHEYAHRAGIPFRSVPSAGLRRHRSWGNLVMPITVIRGILAAYRALRRERPDVLFSKGSYVSVPVGIAAALCQIPVVIHKSDRSLGLANKILARLATTVCLSVPLPANAPGWLQRKAQVTGLPLRTELADGEPERLRARLQIPRHTPVLLIFCGSSSSQRINDAVRSQLDALCARFAVVHVCGRGNVDDSLSGRQGYTQLEYLHDEMPDALALADLVIGRAGATTLAELEALDLPAVLIPLPASVSRGDQIENAHAYAARRAGRCLVLPDDERLTGGAALLGACEDLVPTMGNRQPGADRERVHAAAARIAKITVEAGAPLRRRS